ncbi:hypothetical protein TcasGA2_TC008132 [Tribolium castaneum]|uniref:Uncharacterized protein n=1 Tax=Tribolium castaneum TaxID=7070 RepID=D1ZZZ5_TRICA|nr:hypothetical protein TcasGA2_TC008132 [Tribolium castaneum]
MKLSNWDGSTLFFRRDNVNSPSGLVEIFQGLAVHETVQSGMVSEDPVKYIQGRALTVRRKLKTLSQSLTRTRLSCIIRVIMLSFRRPFTFRRLAAPIIKHLRDSTDCTNGSINSPQARGFNFDTVKFLQPD